MGYQGGLGDCPFNLIADHLETSIRATAAHRSNSLSVSHTQTYKQTHTQTDEGACINLDLECASLTRGHK